MAVRTNLRQQDQTREAIKTSQLVNRLQSFALGEKDANDKPIEIDPSRLKAIEILLRKSLPDLSSVALTGDPDNPAVVEKIERIIVRPPDTNG